MATAPPLTVGITTRERPDDLLRCILSLRQVEDLIAEVLVVDDRSDPPAEIHLRANLPADFQIPIRFIAFARPDGYIVARNRIAREAKSAYLFYLDDDAFLLGREAVDTGLGILENDADVAAIAFAQATAEGRAWPAVAQPSMAMFRAVVCSYIGFGHMLRRDVFLQLGGYRETYVYYAEEKEFCLRLMDQGYKVVYLPDGLIVHLTSAVGRNRKRWFRYNIRNTYLTSLYTHPLAILPVSLLWHTLQYFRTRRASKISDPWGLVGILKEVAFLLPDVIRTRQAVKLSTYRKWRGYRRNPPAYKPALPQSRV